MCGIAGFVNRLGLAADRGIVERMTATLSHRGPDGVGYYRDGPVALGHRRLSIIDVNGGAQPMANEDGSIWVSYNGELYNEFELRRELEAKGHRYRTVSDTESLVHLYEEEGLDFVRRLNGMFALSLWDRNLNRLVLARDRMGQKPLYYGRLPGGGLAFGSEPKAVLRHPEISHDVLVAGRAARKPEVIELIRSMGLHPIDAGPIEVAGHLERMTVLLLSINKANKVK